MPDERTPPANRFRVRTNRKRFVSALASLRPIAFLSVYSILVAGCYDRDDERMYPYRFEPGWAFGAMAGVADLDYDGSDEIVHRAATVIEMANEQWLFSESDGAVIYQVNVPGKVLCAPSFGDIDGERAGTSKSFSRSIEMTRSICTGIIETGHRQAIRFLSRRARSASIPTARRTIGKPKPGSL